uniref:Uncharacterized protein n=1 Tax=uncultured marine virus TaxID=186617 RepID=A0A0F7LB28_9VIRU|nr:hypothetical protein [uncultured marine virus]
MECRTLRRRLADVVPAVALAASHCSADAFCAWSSATENSNVWAPWRARVGRSVINQSHASRNDSASVAELLRRYEEEFFHCARASAIVDTLVRAISAGCSDHPAD